MNKLLIILGTTSTGKTDLAIKLAKQFNGELVSCDSRQVYKGLDIGTGKFPTKILLVKKGKGFWEMGGTIVWMYDVVDQKQIYTVYEYVKNASLVIKKIIAKGRLPIIVGGTGLYLKALLEGFDNLSIPVNQALRKELERCSLEKLQRKLQSVSPDRWEKMNYSGKQNPRRLIRAIELTMMYPRKRKFISLKPKVQNVLKIGLTAPRDILYQRIDERVISRINQGMIEEAENLHKAGLSFERMKQLGLEYGILADYLEGKIISKEDLIKIMQGKIHGFARRQLTWFKKEKEVTWFDVTDKNYIKKIDKLTSKWYDTRYAT